MTARDEARAARDDLASISDSFRASHERASDTHRRVQSARPIRKRSSSSSMTRPSRPTVLVVDDPSPARMCRAALADRTEHVVIAGTLAGAHEALAALVFDIAIVSIATGERLALVADLRSRVRRVVAVGLAREAAELQLRAAGISPATVTIAATWSDAVEAFETLSP